MHALIVEHKQLVLTELPTPVPAAGEVLIRVHYAGVNRADIFQREGSYKAVNPILGLEVSGTIEELGEGVQGFALGDAVCALLSGGGYGEYVAAQAQHCLPIPHPLTLQQAAALPEAAATIWMALMDEASLQPHEKVLLHGGASGVGTLGIQMLRAYGCEVFTTAGTPEKLAKCAALGANAIAYREQDFVEVVKEAGGVDVVLDMVGGEYIDRSLQCLNVGGRLVSIAFLQGSNVQISAGRLLMKRLRWMGATLLARPDAQKAQYVAALRETVGPWIAAGKVIPVIDSVFDLQDAAAAHEKMQKSLHCGKILLKTCYANPHE